MITQASFNNYQQKFYQRIKVSPYKVILRVYSVSATDAYETFIGNSTRTYIDYEFPCLFEKTVNPRIREKYGLPDTIDGVVYLCPLQLIPVFGDFRLDKNKTTVFMEGHEQVISNITYLEPLFNSCISLRLDLRDSLKGG